MCGMRRGINRREVLGAGIVAAAMLASGERPGATRGKVMFRYCLNTSTISGQKLPLPQLVETVAKAGYQGIEPWVREVSAYASGGGSLDDLRKRIADLGLTVENAIGFAKWLVADEAERRKGFDAFRRDMELVARIGCKRIAASPVGVNEVPTYSVQLGAERYRQLIELGRQTGVMPVVEFWGASKNLGRLSEAVAIAAGSGQQEASVLADVYHMYKGGSDFAEIRGLQRGMIQVMHMNDYPADPPRASIRDEHRVWPGDGIAPLREILRDLAAVNPQCVLSLELFNRQYWKMDALEAATTGLEKMKAAVAAAGL